MARRRRAATYSNVEGLDRTLKAMYAGDRLTDGDEALVTMARGLALAVDVQPGSAALWREYRAALAALSVAGAGGDVDDDTSAFLLAIRTPLRPPVGDPKI